VSSTRQQPRTLDPRRPGQGKIEQQAADRATLWQVIQP
jgi:hypothetical protein